MNARAVPVLMYHHVSPFPGLVTISPATFRAHMERIAHAGYATLNASQLTGWIKGQVSVPTKSVLITFDDGYLDNYVYAYPVLRQLGLHAVIFTVTGWIGDGPARRFHGEGLVPVTPDHSACKRRIEQERADEVMLRWSEIERMARDDTIEIHSHTHSHLRWDKLYPDPHMRLQALIEDLEQSRLTLQKRLGIDDQHLCWPWGHYDAAYTDLARKLGFETQYTVERGTNHLHDDPQHIKRIDTKERSGGWLARQLFTYRSPLRSSAYLAIRRH